MDVDIRNPVNDYTPLMEAVKSSAAGVEMLRMLIERGADVNARLVSRRIDNESAAKNGA